MRGNPVFWLHVQLFRGWRNTLIIAALYVLLFAAGVALAYRAGGPNADFAAVSAGALGFVTLSQGLFLLLLGPGAIHKSIQRDFQTGMIESHRISPMSGSKIVLGYLSGAHVQAGTLYVASLLLGTYFASQLKLGYAVGAWWSVQLCIVCLALMFSSLSLLVSLASRGKVNVVVIVLILSLIGGWAVVMFIPGLALLGGWMTGQMLFNVFGGKTNLISDATLAAAGIFTQVAISLTFLVACYRKVRAPERPLFPVPLAFVLLVIGGAVLALGTGIQSGVGQVAAREFGSGLGAIQLLTAAIVFIAVAQFPLTAAALECFFVDRAHAFGDAARTTRRTALLLVPVVLAGLTVLLVKIVLFTLSEECDADLGVLTAALDRLPQYAAILVALALSFWIDFNVIYIMKTLGRHPIWAVLLSAIILKILPIVLDGALIFLASLRDVDLWLVEGYFAGASPIGTLVLCTLPGGQPLYGLAFQVLLAGAATYFGLRFKRLVGPARVPHA